jgi:hypothetical protein
MSIKRAALCLVVILAACNPASLPGPSSGLTIEEHALAQRPSTEGLAFEPLDGSMEAILARHAAERSRVIPNESAFIDGHSTMQASLGTDLIAAYEYYRSSDFSNWVIVTCNGKEIYRVGTGMPSPITGLRGLWTYDDHWVLETAYISPESFSGNLTLDGSLPNPAMGYEQVFDFQLMHTRPFYFFQKDGRIGLSYDGQAAAASYDEVPHYQCCSASVLNPLHAEDMVAFFARRGSTWYYVEAGVFDK